jgi:hypothetical protein
MTTIDFKRFASLEGEFEKRIPAHAATVNGRLAASAKRG